MNILFVAIVVLVVLYILYVNGYLVLPAPLQNIINGIKSFFGIVKEITGSSSTGMTNDGKWTDIYVSEADHLTRPSERGALLPDPLPYSGVPIRYVNSD